MYQLVIQFSGDGVDDFDKLVALEEALFELRDLPATDDGHDAGVGELNLFMLTDEPEQEFRRCLPTVEACELQLVGAAFRNLETEAYTRLWPRGSRVAFNVA